MVYKRQFVRSVSIDEEVNNWINDFKDKMLIFQNQQVPYTTVLNLLVEFGILLLSNPGELTEKQKSIIIEYIKESTGYKPPHTIFTWSDKYKQCLVPKLLDGTIKEPFEY